MVSFFFLNEDQLESALPLVECFFFCVQRPTCAYFLAGWRCCFVRVVALLCDAVCLASFPCGVLGVLKLVDGTDRGFRWLCVLNAKP